jgi:hypothetical protein
MSECVEISGKISILEKINRLTQLFDPWLMPIDLIQLYAENLGYDVGLNRGEIPTIIGADPIAAEIEANKYLRFMTSQLPEWYKVKTSRPSLKVMLYSFGLIGDVVYYYTKKYTDLIARDNNQILFDRLNTAGYQTYEELYAAICELQVNVTDLRTALTNDWLLSKWNPSSIQEDISNIPDDYFPSPHFRLWFNLLESAESSNYSTDVARNDMITKAILSIRPLNTVFDGVSGYMMVHADIHVMPKVRFRKNIFLCSDSSLPADNWATVV